MDHTYLQYQVSYIPINAPGTKNVLANTVTFINQGASTAFLNGTVRILPNQGFTIQGYPGEICKHAFDISFQGVGSNQLVMITKNYPEKL